LGRFGGILKQDSGTYFFFGGKSLGNDPDRQRQYIPMAPARRAIGTLTGGGPKSGEIVILATVQRKFGHYYFEMKKKKNDHR